MKQIYLVLTCVVMAWLPMNAQISEGGTPYGQRLGLPLDAVERAQLPTFDLQQVIAEDNEVEKQGNYPRIGRIRPMNVALNAVDAWTPTKDGRVWRFALKSRDALGVAVQFEDFQIPAGAKLFIYSPDYAHIIGAFTEFNNHESGVFSTQPIPSDEVIVEYFEPTAAIGQGNFRISGLLHAYRMVPGAEGAQRDFGDSDPCQVNVNCSEGNNWQDEKRGVVRILVIEGQFAGWCSGSLVNNTAQDCTPYILTALHCGLSATNANMNQWVFYFNYESSGCSNGSSGQVPNNTITGCARIADSGDGGGDNGSDFLLVELNSDVPAGFNPYYNGWRATTASSSSGVSIHHPAGDIKKISTYNSTLQSVTWGGPSGTHWLVTWSSTSNGWGVTEGGSSGSPIFDNQGRIIGTLTGGSSFCSNPTSPDLYGKMSYHWGSNPGDDLSDFLDPGNTGATTLGGSNDPCNGQGGGGDDCLAGTITSSLNQTVCPGETGVFNASGIAFPASGGYAVQFLPDGGTGANGVGFSITAVQPLPFTFDADVNGILSANGLPPMSGQWVLTGVAYSDQDDFANSVCELTTQEITVNFASASDPACNGGGGDNNNCSDAISVNPGSYAFSTVGATTDGPDQPGSDCDAFDQSNVNNDIWYEYTATCSGTATLSTCDAADFDTRLAIYPGGACPPSGASLIACNDDFGDCTGFTSEVTWSITQGNTYLLRIGGYGPGDSGSGTFTLSEDCGSGGCAASIPYPLSDPCVITVITDDPFCCDTEWDSVCEDAYIECQGGGGDCVAGTISSPLTQDLCPGDEGILDATGVVIPVGGAYAVQFLPDGGTGANEVGFSITGIETLPFTFDEDVNGILSANGLPPMQGQWLITGLVYSDLEDFANSVCDFTAVDITVNFLSASDPACGGGGDCVSDIPYPLNDPCVISVITDDPFCCDTEWDSVCEDAYQDCLSPGGDECLDWVDPSPTTGWSNFNTEFGGAPANDGTGCPVFEITDFEVWMSEAYAMDNVVAGTSYTFSHCNGPGAGSWVPDYTIIAPSGAVDAFGAGDGDGCSITWTASESGTYLIVINEAGNCGNGAQINNGYPSITCNDEVTGLSEIDGEGVFAIFPNPNNGQFNVVFNQTTGQVQLDVLEVSGKIIQTATIVAEDGAVYPVDLGDRAAGMYFVRLTHQNQVSVQKVTVQ